MNVDIVIPVFNQAEALSMVLEGFVKQKTEYEYKVIVVNDGSDEDIEQIVLNKSPKITYLSQHNSGRSRARNYGVENGTGDLIIFNDSDRIPCPYFINEHVKSHLNSDNCRIVMGLPKEIYFKEYTKYKTKINQIVGGETNLSRTTRFTKNVLKIYDSLGKTDSLIPWISTFSGNMSLSRKMFEKHLFDEKFTKWGFENIELGYRLFLEKGQFEYNSSAVNYHLAHPREANFYEKGILASDQYLQEKYGPSPLSYVKSFILGEISLQMFEKLVGNQNADWMKYNIEPVENYLVKV